MVLKIPSTVAWWMLSVRALGSKEGGEKLAKEGDTQKISILRTSKVKILMLIGMDQHRGLV